MAISLTAYLLPLVHTAWHNMRWSPSFGVLQVVEELFTYWSLEDADDTLEELEEALIVRRSFICAINCLQCYKHPDAVMICCRLLILGPKPLSK